MSIASLVQGSVSRGAPSPTHIYFVVDRSGSMSPYIDGVVNSVSHLITDQQESKGKASFTLAQFDDQYETIFDHLELKQVDKNTFKKMYRPRGGTALLDAIFQSTKDMEYYLEKNPKRNENERIVMAYMTDGEENSSKHKVHEINELIKAKMEQGWDFMMLGATQNTLETATAYGFLEDKTAIYSAENPDAAIKLISDKVLQARRGKKIEITEGEKQLLLCSEEQCKSEQSKKGWGI